MMSRGSRIFFHHNIEYKQQLSVMKFKFEISISKIKIAQTIIMLFLMRILIRSVVEDDSVYFLKQ
jgi:hypothetical protein